MVDVVEVFAVPTVAAAGWRAEIVLAATVLLGLIASVRPGPWPRLLVAAGLAASTWLALAAWLDLGAGPALALRPLGDHFVVDPPAALARVVILATTLLVMLNLSRPDHRGSVVLALSALGLIWLSEAATAGGLLLAVAAAVSGASLAAWCYAAPAGRPAVRRWHLTATLGFGLLACGAALSSGLSGSLELVGLLDRVALRPYLPAGSLAAFLGCGGVGLALSLLGEPGRFAAAGPAGDHREVLAPALSAWLTAVPPVALAALLTRFFQTSTDAPPAALAAGWLTWAAGILLLGGFLAALVQPTLERRLVWAATGQVGLALTGFLVAGSASGTAPGSAPLQLLLVFAPAQLGALLIVRSVASLTTAERRRHLVSYVFASLLVGLAALPPLAGWRPRFALLQVLLSADHYPGAALVLVGTLLGCWVYLRPLVDLWRLDGDRAPTGDAAGPALSWSTGAVMTAAALLALLLAWGLGMSPLLPESGLIP